MNLTPDEWLEQMEKDLNTLGTQVALTHSADSQKLKTIMGNMEAWAGRARERRVQWAGSILEEIRNLVHQLDAGHACEHVLLKMMHLVIESSRNLYHLRLDMELEKEARAKNNHAGTGNNVFAS